MDNNGNSSISEQSSSAGAIEATEEILIKIPSTIAHLIDNQTSIELAYGDLEILLLTQNNAAVAVIARIGDQLQWPLTKDVAALKLDNSHYFFTLSLPNDDDDDVVLNYGITIPSKGQEQLLSKLDAVLDKYSGWFNNKEEEGEVELEWWVAAREVGPNEVEEDEEKREKLEESAAAYWTTLAPNVEEYSGCVARKIAAGSGMVVKGILWCGEVTVDRLNWGNQFLKNRLGKSHSAAALQVSPQCLSRIRRLQRRRGGVLVAGLVLDVGEAACWAGDGRSSERTRVKSLTKRSEDAATAILSGVIRVSETVTGAVVNSRMGKLFFNMSPGEIILASFDGFQKICDAVEFAGKNVMSTSSSVTTDLVTERYGEEAARATSEGLDAAGHAMGTAWTVFKLRKALNPKRALKPTALAKAAAAKVKKAS